MNTSYTIQYNELVVNLGKGDPMALNDLFKIYYTRLVFFATRIVNESGEAEDCTVSAFLKLWQLRDRFNNIHEVESFLYTTIRNSCYDYLKKVKRQNIHARGFLSNMDIEEENYYELEKIRSEILSVIHMEINNLPPKCKQVFKMLYFDNLDVEEIARFMSTSVQTVYNHKSKAVNYLRKAVLKSKLLMVIGLIYSIVY